VLAEEVRKEAWDKVVLETAEVFVWWLSFVKRISEEPTDPQDPDAIYYLPTSASDIVWFKFPNLCPVCFGFQLIEGKQIKESDKDFNKVSRAIKDDALISAYNAISKQPCKCMSRKKAIEARSGEFKTFVKEQLSRLCNIPTIRAQKTASLKGLEATIQKIYEPSVFVLTMHEVAFHLLEEIGEVSEALVRLVSQPIPQNNLSNEALKKFRAEHIKRLKNVREELGDVFSWLIAMRSKTHNVLHRSVNYVERFHTSDDVMKTAKQIVKKFLKPTESLVDLVWQIYSDNGNILVCEECKERPCNPKSSKHKDDSGELFGDKVTKVYGQIKTITPASL
jgi:NTP pyrophosphatase (non-canonical NTP hydrolase)